MPRHLHSLNWEELAEKADFSAHKLAALCKVSLRTVERHFQEQKGLRVSKWLRELRLKSAYAALRKSRSVKEVAWEFSYKQVSHFSKDFKKRFGLNPSIILGADLDGGVKPAAAPMLTGDHRQLVFCFYCGGRLRKFCIRPPSAPCQFLHGSLHNTDKKNHEP